MVAVRVDSCQRSHGVGRLEVLTPWPDGLRMLTRFILRESVRGNNH